MNVPPFHLAWIETQQAEPEAAQAGQLAEVRASQQVIEQQTELAQLQADRADRRKPKSAAPADTNACRKRPVAEAARGKTKSGGDA